MSWPKGLHRPRGRCRTCGKVLALSAPSGDWLNALYPRLHYADSGEVCEGTWREVEIEVSEQRISKEKP